MAPARSTFVCVAVAGCLLGPVESARAQATLPPPSDGTWRFSMTPPAPPRHLEPAGRLDAGGEIRLRAERRQNAGFQPANDDGYLLSRIRLHMNVYGGPWFRAHVEAQDSHVVGAAPTTNTDGFVNTFELRQAYVDVFHRRDKGLGLRIGRQELRYGDERLIGPDNWGNIGRSWDAAQVYYDSEDVKVHGIVAAVVRTRDRQFDRTTSGDWIAGGYATVSTASDTTWDLYLIWRSRTGLANGSGGTGGADRVTFGSRAVHAVSDRVDLRGELAGQIGRQAGNPARAWAAKAQVDYLLATAAAPRLEVEYIFASGDARPTDGRIGTYEELFPSNHRMPGIADLVGTQNLRDVRVGVSFSPHSRVVMTVDHHAFWLSSGTDAFYDAPGAPVARLPAGAASRHIGRELDVYGTVTIDERHSIAAGAGHFFAGGFLRQATAGSSTTYSYVALTYRF